MKNKEKELIEEAYYKLLDILIKDDLIYDLVVEYKDIKGLTIKYSWRDRDERLEKR